MSISVNYVEKSDNDKQSFLILKTIQFNKLSINIL